MISKKMDVSRVHNTKWNKSDIKRQILHFCSYFILEARLQEGVRIERREKVMGWEAGRRENKRRDIQTDRGKDNRSMIDW